MIISAGLFLGCSSSISFEKRTFEDLFTMDVESTMVNMDNNDPYAHTKYGNRYKEFYFKVMHSEIEDHRTDIRRLDMSKEDIFKLYVAYTESLYEDQMSGLEWLDSTAREINSMKSVIHEVTTNGNEFPIRYKIAYYLSDTRIYELHVWATENRIHRFNDGMNRMINSFQELHP
ncbi:MAG: hypothetical protein JKY54_05280 [Flavobacteriales bacterium]|nr:hypothetical protein [Flavobacteriales bacterium]